VSAEQVVEAISAGDTYRVMSLDEPTAEDGLTALDVLGGCDTNFERAEQRMLLDGGLERLAPREREILRLRFYEGLTQREIADAIGISQMHVSRLIRRSIEVLRVTLAERQARAA
jgi:RNA polymerase sigma-B factor